MCIKFICRCLCGILERCVCIFCPPLYNFFFADCNQMRRLKCTNFLCGFALVQAYYYYLWRRIPIPYHLGEITAFILSLLVGISNAVSIQARCISVLIFPMYCGTAGRGVLKVVVLTYVVAVVSAPTKRDVKKRLIKLLWKEVIEPYQQPIGPITNMGINAREVVRVFACTTQLAYNLSIAEHVTRAEPFRKTALSLRDELDQLKDTLQSVTDVVEPIAYEIEDPTEILLKQQINNFLDDLMCIDCRSQFINKKFSTESSKQRVDELNIQEQMNYYHKLYLKKLDNRCETQLSTAVAVCIKAFEEAYANCLVSLPYGCPKLVCRPLRYDNVCTVLPSIHNYTLCDSRTQIDPGFKEAYFALKRAQDEFTTKAQDTKLQYKISYERDLYDIQDAKETGERVIRAFEEKTSLMCKISIALNVYVALLFLRILSAAIYYHDNYLTNIEYDNIYITRYFKKLDDRRKIKSELTLLPLKKMERIKYIDVHSMSYKAAERSKFLTQILKVMLEMVTATTFVMLDRLFFEALDVVRQHAQNDLVHTAPRDLEIEVEGTGMLASLFRKLLSNISPRSVPYTISKDCVPNPQAMSPYYYIKIYGGYLWILVLLYVNPYMLRTRRLICSYFYARREKQRILHLYNDILKKRMKMDKTLRRKAVQAVRAHYLSGENLLSLRIKFPRALGWLRILPAARMTCLICGETEPRIETADDKWHLCCVPNCPFVFCAECWRETDARCLACDPSLVELSDMDSLSDDEHPKY